MRDPIFPYLTNTIKWLTEGHGFHINIHDASGITHNIETLSLTKNYTAHTTPFCRLAKTTPKGLEACLQCKTRSILKAVNEKKLYTGQCYLGITEIVMPVFSGDKLLCVIYLGNLVTKNDLAICYEKIHKNALNTGVNPHLLHDALATVETVSTEQLNNYKEIVNILYHSILNTTRDIDKTSHIMTPPKSWLIKAICDYALIYYNNELKLSQFSDMYFINYNYLCRLFKKELGITFSEYINQIRVDIAKEKLSLTEDSILNIAMGIGYNNVTYFNRIFKRIEGVSPSDYRKKQALL